MNVQVSRIQKTLTVLVAKPAAWLLYGCWLAGIHVLFAFGWLSERFRGWWRKGKDKKRHEPSAGLDQPSTAA